MTEKTTKNYGFYGILKWEGSLLIPSFPFILSSLPSSPSTPSLFLLSPPLVPPLPSSPKSLGSICGCTADSESVSECQTYPAAKHHQPLVRTKLYILVRGARL